MFTPLRKAVIAGAGLVALGAGTGVGVHSAMTATLTSANTPNVSTAATSPNPATTPDPTDCRHGHGEKGAAAEQLISITASVTGQTPQQILDQLKAGKTLNQIAGSNAATVEQQAIAKLKTALDQRVAAGKLDAAREQTMLDKAKTALDKTMSSDLSGKLPPAGAAACAPRGLLGTLVKVTADKTGLTVQQVLDQLKAGKSIDQIAGSKAADVKATVLQMEQQKLSSELDKLMGRSGLPDPKLGHGPGGAKPNTSPSPAA
ncbi:MAG TPA: hypothetical protein VN193_10390 [Candidatus Angelobacter sp.]|nr:hypothetical protein [Candidatus Angelobacter sp.]